MTMNPSEAARPGASTPPRTAVVIGAGVAGLAAAIRLKEFGAGRVIVLERESQPGGLAISLRYEGVKTDLGPHRIHTEIPEVERFYRDVAGESMIRVVRKSRMRLGDRFIPYPPGVGDLLKGLGPWRLAGFAAGWAADRIAGAFGRLDPTTYEGYMRRSFGSGLYNWLLKPYTEKVWKCPTENLDADAARVRVSAGSLARMTRRLFSLRERKGAETALKEFHYVKGGAETLVRHMADRATSLGAEILLGCEAKGFELEEDRIARILAESPEGAETIGCDAVISTAPLPELAEMARQGGGLDDVALESARSLRYLDMIFVAVIVQREVVSGDTWLYFPGPETIFNRVYEAKAFDPEMAPRDRSVLCAEITCRPGEDAWLEPDDAIARRVVEQLAATGLFRADEVLSRHVHRLRYGYPVYTQRYGQKVDQALAALARIENLVTTGRQGLFNFNNMDHSIYMGLSAAECVCTADRPADKWLGQNEVFRGFRIVD
ncbi:MAG: hypothetical protein BWZ10_00245 [candidate division BRC1 bacterium ADurb.BinA364]|nr:MAG: hypothetical protein BWZ10_00245 [candidate division BRC1 bacterium ADurb.BinA364]